MQPTAQAVGSREEEEKNRRGRKKQMFGDEAGVDMADGKADSSLRSEWQLLFEFGFLNSDFLNLGFEFGFSHSKMRRGYFLAALTRIVCGTACNWRIRSWSQGRL